MRCKIELHLFETLYFEKTNKRHQSGVLSCRQRLFLPREYEAKALSLIAQSHLLHVINSDLKLNLDL